MLGAIVGAGDRNHLACFRGGCLPVESESEEPIVLNGLLGGIPRGGLPRAPDRTGRRVTTYDGLVRNE